MTSAAAPIERPTEYPHIVRAVGVMAGEPCLEGHRIRVRDIVAMRDLHGCSAEKIVAEHYPHVALAKVYAALAYAEDHRDELAMLQVQEDACVQTFKEQNAALIVADLGE